jgi:hypothetical protein
VWFGASSGCSALIQDFNFYSYHKNVTMTLKYDDGRWKMYARRRGQNQRYIASSESRFAVQPGIHIWTFYDTRGAVKSEINLITDLLP